jgi:hypothetical protein
MKAIKPIISLITLILCTVSYGQGCGAWTTVGKLKARKFEDGSIAVRTKLAVNPDGTDLSYTKNDHGFTYINNGLALWQNGASIRCDKRENSANCSAKFKDAEARAFAQGTAEFCVFGMVVQHISLNTATQACGGGGRKIAGNGKGRLVELPSVRNVAGLMVTPYQSQTSLQHQVVVEGKTKNVFIDSATIPTAVYPTSLPMKGRLVWAQYPSSGKSVVTIAGDQGPALGEGSIAMHQLLVDGKLTNQLTGPIPATERCKSSELNLPPPFLSRPDGGKIDSCRATANKPSTGTDIRGYKELPQVAWAKRR